MLSYKLRYAAGAQATILNVFTPGRYRYRGSLARDGRNSWELVGPRYTPMIKSKPAALPSYCYEWPEPLVTYTVEATLPATPPAVFSGESATLRLPLSIINGDALRIHATERPRGRAVPCQRNLNTRYEYSEPLTT